MNRDINIQMEQEECNENFGCVGRIDPEYEKIYVDLTGESPLPSINSITTVFILYDWTSNAIYPLLSPMQIMKL